MYEFLHALAHKGKNYARNFILTMKLTAIILFIGLIQVHAASLAQINISKTTITRENVFKEIRRQAGYDFFYDAELFKNLKPLPLEAKNATVQEVINKALSGLPMSYKIIGKTVIINGNPVMQKDNSDPAQERFRIDGKVKDDQGKPMAGVSIFLKGGNRVLAVTDNDGYFLILDAKENDILIFRYIGYSLKEARVGKKPLEIVLNPVSSELKEVVISTGYQNIENKYNTGAVTTLKMDSIKVPGINTIDRLLEGRVPGMTYMQNSGQVGATPRLRIRGTSTILGNQEPLWVVDGVVVRDPVNVSASRINDLDFVNLIGNSISGLNPDDIEQIDVLKDAASTAIYGARAANGVIVITTKKGQIGPPLFSFSTNATLSRRPRYTDESINMMNSFQRVDVSREMFERGIIYSNQSTFSGYERTYLDYANGKIDFNTFQNQSAYYETLNTDWFDLVGRDALSSNQTVSVSGGSNVTKYYASLGFNNENGTIKNEFNKRYSSSLSLTTTYNKFSMQFGLQANVTNRHYNPGDIPVLNYAYNTSRAIPAYNTDGSLSYYPKSNGSGLNYNYNILNEMNNSSDQTKSNGMTLTSKLDYRFTNAFKLSGTLSYSINNTNQQVYYGANTFKVLGYQGNGTLAGNLAPIGGELQMSQTMQNGYTIRLQSDYNKKFGATQKHYVFASLGTEVSSAKYDGFNITRRGYQQDRGNVFAAIPTTYTGYYSQFMTSAAALGIINTQLTNILSAYLSATYNYDERYTFNFNVRSDESNQFGAANNNKFLPVYSVSGRWDIKNDLLKNTNWVNGLAIKPSFGYQGNMLDNQSSNLVLQRGSYNNIYAGNQSTIVGYPNPDLTWEKTSSTNLSVDFSLFNHKLAGTVSYFYKHTKDAFLNKTVSDVNGLTQYVVNSGELTNKGLEISLNFTPINKGLNSSGKQGFIWRFDPQLGQVVNQLITKAVNNRNNVLQNTITYADLLSGNIQLSGVPLNTFYSYKFKGLNATDGSPIFYGAEASNSTALAKLYSGMNVQDVYLAVMAPSGTRVPTIQGGLSNFFGYKNFSLSFNFTYSLGNKIRLLKVTSGYGTASPDPQTNLRAEVANRWRQPGDEAFTNIPGLNVTPFAYNPIWFAGTSYAFANNYYDMYDNSDIRVVKGDYLKLQSLAFAYNFSAAICKKLSIKSANVGLNGANLFTLASSELKGQDPTQSGTTPNISLALYPIYTINLGIRF
ncbi:SusC/RagA family TonB-linked outer membrane protein [Pedobacter frigidisoli]|uniref:SusC/RagA family TonB-linked outer membrane protein n=1 Tax=Pedobacter frigidisoli TaxID=2530455 RepID=UPI00292E0BA9|nr:SusC/RagA family TonB-linked outer membrane protein [Pedobacter frigidisoli]